MSRLEGPQSVFDEAVGRPCGFSQFIWVYHHPSGFAMAPQGLAKAVGFQHGEPA